MKVARFLENHPKVEKVFYPGSQTFDQPELFEKYLSGTNGLLSFVLKGSADRMRKFANSLHYFQNGCSWGGFESLCVFLEANEEAKKFGQPEHLLRIHVGLENVDTLIADMEQALQKS
jgi:cystathionine gamma-lyase